MARKRLPANPSTAIARVKREEPIAKPPPVRRSPRNVKQEEAAGIVAVAQRAVQRPAKAAPRPRATQQQQPVFQVPETLKPDLRKAAKRWEFNLAQIEQRYCGKASGLVFDLKTDTLEFDEELCTMENDAELIKAAKKQFRHHTLQDFGSCLLSAPAVDELETDPKAISRWEKLNKLCNVYLNAFDKKPQNSAFTQNQGRQVAVRNAAQAKREAPNGPLFPAAFGDPAMEMFAQNDAGSVAASGAIPEPPVVPLVREYKHEVKREFNTTWPIYEPPQTRSRTRQLAIEANYAKQQTLFSGDGDWVDRWVDQAALNTSIGAFEHHNLE